MLTARPEADLVVVATQDVDHLEPVVGFLEAGYDVLVEKPMAPTREDAEQMVLAAERTGRNLVVAHVLRYQTYTKQLLDLIQSGTIGDIVVIDHLEPIGDQHFAHSYVRGNWRNEADASSALMSKSCHDIDWISAIVGKRATKVSSFGSLHHFRAENAPAGAAERCVECAVEADCAFSAKRYLPLFREKGWTWPVDVIAEEPLESAIEAAIETGPYGRCVYRCDNDVVDHQVVNIEFEGGETASFTMSAFTPKGHRRSRIGGTRGFLEGNTETITHFDYFTQKTQTYQVDHGGGSSAGEGHAGGDLGLIADVVNAITSGDWSVIPTDARESLNTHSIVWAAERARKTGTVEAVRY